MSAFTGTLSAIDRNHCPPSYGMPVRLHRNPQLVDVRCVFVVHGFSQLDLCPSFETPRFARFLRMRWYPYAKCFEIKRATRSAWVLATS
jgi:hypothetical protein